MILVKWPLKITVWARKHLEIKSLFLLQSSVREGGGYVVSGVHSGRAEWRTALVSRRERDRSTLHHTEGSGTPASRADEAFLQQPPLPRPTGGLLSVSYSSPRFLSLIFSLVSLNKFSLSLPGFSVLWLIGLRWLIRSCWACMSLCVLVFVCAFECVRCWLIPANKTQEQAAVPESLLLLSLFFPLSLMHTVNHIIPVIS